MLKLLPTAIFVDLRLTTVIALEDVRRCNAAAALPCRRRRAERRQCVHAAATVSTKEPRDEQTVGTWPNSETVIIPSYQISPILLHISMYLFMLHAFDWPPTVVFD